MQKYSYKPKCKPEYWLAFICSFFLFGLAAAEDGEIDEVRQLELRYLLKQDCGSCHGLTLEGGLGPALLPEHVAGKPGEQLQQAILDGIPGTAMPPWRPFITESEAGWLVQILQQGAFDE